MKILGIFGIIIGISYLLTVAITLGIVWGINIAFGLSLDPNIWALGFIVWLVLWIIRPLTN